MYHDRYGRMHDTSPPQLAKPFNVPAPKGTDYQDSMPAKEMNSLSTMQAEQVISQRLLSRQRGGTPKLQYGQSLHTPYSKQPRVGN